MFNSGCWKVKSLDCLIFNSLTRLIFNSLARLKFNNSFACLMLNFLCLKVDFWQIWYKSLLKLTDIEYKPLGWNFTKPMNKSVFVKSHLTHHFHLRSLPGTLFVISRQPTRRCPKNFWISLCRAHGLKTQGNDSRERSTEISSSWGLNFEILCFFNWSWISNWNSLNPFLPTGPKMPPQLNF